MTERDDAALAPRDRELVERIAGEYAPPAETPARRAAFGEALRARLERRRRPLWVPALVAVAAAGVVWLALPSSSPPGPATLDPAAWEYELLVSSDLSPSDDRDESRFLPEDYQAIAVAFLGS